MKDVFFKKQKKYEETNCYSTYNEKKNISILLNQLIKRFKSSLNILSSSMIIHPMAQQMRF